jgi:C-terminal processing protease CtpA/Prc
MTVVKVTVFKPSKGSKLGIRLTRKDDSSPLTISGISYHGLFSKTPLVPGLVVLQIDDQEVTWMSPKEACDILRSVDNGDVSVTAEGFVGKIVRKRTDENLGIIKRNYDNGVFIGENKNKSHDDIFIARIKEESKFFNTDIKTGMKIISINNSPCPASAVKAIRIMRNTVGKLKIVAVNVNRERPAPSARVPENAQPEANKELEGSWLKLENDAMRRNI